MTRTSLYAGIFVVLFVFATIQVAVEEVGYLEEAYWMALGLIVILSVIKAVFVAAYYQHLRWEPPGITYVILGGLLAAVALTIAASYSIT